MEDFSVLKWGTSNHSEPSDIAIGASAIELLKRLYLLHEDFCTVCVGCCI